MVLMIRKLLIWLLMLAIPAQGVSAATMAVCGLAHQGGVAAAGDAHHPATAGHGHENPESRLAHDQPMAHAMAAAASDAGTADEAESGCADKHPCNVCGSCCSTGPLLSDGPGWPEPEAAPAAFPAIVATVDPFAAVGLERPPRKPFV